MFFTVSTACPRPSGPVRKPEMLRPGRNGVSSISAPQNASSRLPSGSLNEISPRTRLASTSVAGSAIASTPAASRRARVERSGVSDFPAEETRSLGSRTVDDDPLLAVVHSEGEQRIASLDRLQADQAGAELPPVFERIRSEAGISQTQQWHRASPASCCCWPNPTRIFRLSNQKDAAETGKREPRSRDRPLTFPRRHGV